MVSKLPSKDREREREKERATNCPDLLRTRGFQRMGFSMVKSRNYWVNWDELVILREWVCLTAACRFEARAELLRTGESSEHSHQWGSVFPQAAHTDSCKHVRSIFNKCFFGGSSVLVCLGHCSSLSGWWYHSLRWKMLDVEKAWQKIWFCLSCVEFKGTGKSRVECLS